MHCLRLVVKVRFRGLYGECGQAGDAADHVINRAVRQQECEKFGDGHAGAVVEDED